MESAHKRFLFTGWDASENYLVRYTHSFVFAMHRNSWIKIVHVHFTWNNLCFLQDPRVSKKRSRYYTPGKELPHMRCFNCNEKGHLSQFCPEPKVHTFSWYLPFRYIWFFCLNRLKDMDHLYFHYYLVTAASSLSSHYFSAGKWYHVKSWVLIFSCDIEILSAFAMGGGGGGNLWWTSISSKVSSNTPSCTEEQKPRWA